MNEVYDKLMNCYKSVREKTDFVPEVALVLGSGLGDYADHIQVVTEINYSDIEGFPVSTVVGHAGKFIFGYVGKVPVVCMKGRVHYYEGYPVSDVVLPTRLMKLLGAKILFLSNASGGMNRKFQDLIRTTAKENNIPLQEGVYVQLTGPSYESPAEIRMLADYADAVGMSTVVEAIAANHCGLRVCGISCVCNLAAGMNPTPLSHKEVQEAADKAAPLFTELVTKVIEKIGAIK